MNTYSILILAITAMLIMAIGIVGFVFLYQRRVIQNQIEIEKINKQKQLDLLNASIHSEEEERKRIASELHDDVGASLAAIKLLLYNKKSQEVGSEENKYIKALLDDTIQKVRNVSHKLQPAILMQMGLEKALQSYVGVINRSGKLVIRYHPSGPTEELDSHIKLGVYRILQELVSNILKHADARKIDIFTFKEMRKFVAIVTHDGAGLTQDQFEKYTYKESATGLKNITNRLRLMHASIHFSVCSKTLKSRIEIKVFEMR